MCGCYPTATKREGERERECKARHSNAACVGPAWLQWHGCGFIKGVKLEERGGRHTKAKQGKEQLYFNQFIIIIIIIIISITVHPGN